MSCCSINNVARVVDVRQVLPIDSLNASNEPTPPSITAERGVRFAPTVQGSTPGVGDNSEAINTMMALFSSFFTQLINLLSERKEKTVPDIPPPRPEVAPRVVPEPVAPRPAPAVNIPGLSNKRNGTKPDNIWSGFRQGPDGNCVTVSAIKAAMHRFGQSPTDIFKEVQRTGDGYQVIMRDDFRLTLSDRELIEGARGAKFIGADKGMLQDAQFLFAASAKRAQMENNDRTASRSYQAAIRSLNDGEDETGPGEGFLRLGLRKHMKRVAVSELARGQLGMCNRTGHSVAVINGREELWGRQGSAPTQGQAVALM
ncbi:hypothetical protein FX985_05746 [Pseudomonas extremaustralis]|nr:hypothetical protein FX985_05746 [Pseudomonas extremaustralis]